MSERSPVQVIDPSGDGNEGGGDVARRQRLLSMLSSVDVANDGAGPDGGRARLGPVCALVVSEVGVSGAGVTVMAGVTGGLAGDRDQVWATGPVTRRLEDLQLTTGQGPCLDAYADGAPVSLPLQVGAARLGTLDLHREAVGELSREQLADGLVLAGVATEILLDLAAEDPARPPEADVGAGSGEGTFGWLPGAHAAVHQASGMVSGRERIGVEQALLRIRAHAYAHGEPIEQVARRILERTLTLPEHRVDETDVVPDDRPDPHPDDPPDVGPTGPPGPDVETDR